MPIGRPHRQPVLFAPQTNFGRTLGRGDALRVWLRPRSDLRRFVTDPGSSTTRTLDPTAPGYDGALMEALRTTDDDLFLEAATLVEETVREVFDGGVSVAISTLTKAPLSKSGWDLYLATDGALNVLSRSRNPGDMDRDDYALLVDPAPDGRRALYVGGRSTRRDGRWDVSGSGYGVFFGVARLLTRLCGVRWIFPGRVGTVYPRHARVPVEGINELDGPDYRDRTLTSAEAPADLDLVREEVRRWMLCNGMRPWLQRLTGPVASGRIKLPRLGGAALDVVFPRPPTGADNDVVLPEARYNISHALSRYIPSAEVSTSIGVLNHGANWDRDAGLYPQIVETDGDLLPSAADFAAITTTLPSTEDRAVRSLTQVTDPSVRSRYGAFLDRFEIARRARGVWHFRPKMNDAIRSSEGFQPCHFIPSPTAVGEIDRVSPWDLSEQVALRPSLVTGVGDAVRRYLAAYPLLDSAPIAAADNAIACRCRPCLAMSSAQALESPSAYSWYRVREQITRVNAIATYVFGEAPDDRRLVFLAYHGQGTLWPSGVGFGLIRTSPIAGFGALHIKPSAEGGGVDLLWGTLGDLPILPDVAPIEEERVPSLHRNAMPYVATTHDDDDWEPGVETEGAADRELHARWGVAARQTGVYDYLTSYGSFVPRLHPRRIAEALRFAWAHNARGYFAENFVHWGVDGLHVWVLANVLWELGEPAASAAGDARVAELTREFCVALYGADAARPMGEALQMLEDMWCGRRVQVPAGGRFGDMVFQTRPRVSRSERGRHGGDPHLGYLGNRLGPFDLASVSVLNRALTLIDRANAAVDDATDDPEGPDTRELRRRRIAFTRVPLTAMRDALPFFHAWRAVERAVVEFFGSLGQFGDRDAFAQNQEVAPLAPLIIALAEATRVDRDFLAARAAVVRASESLFASAGRRFGAAPPDVRGRDLDDHDTRGFYAFNFTSSRGLHGGTPAFTDRQGIAAGMDVIFANIAVMHNKLIRMLAGVDLVQSAVRFSMPTMNSAIDAVLIGALRDRSSLFRRLGSKIRQERDELWMLPV